MYINGPKSILNIFGEVPSIFDLCAVYVGTYPTCWLNARNFDWEGPKMENFCDV